MQKTILITGCSSGIGYAAAHGLKAQGWRVFASCRQQADCDRLATEGLETVQLDYADEASIETALAQVLQATGGTLDALYNNGAFACPGAAEDLPRGALREIFEVNLFGIHDLTRRVIPVMRAQGHGHIINCSSILGLVVAPWRAAYSSTKFALEALTDTLRIEMRDTNIKVVLLEPGPVTSHIRKNAIPHFEKWIDWENSPRADQYRDSLIKRLYDSRAKKDLFELPPEAVTAKLTRILNSNNPRPRYYVTTATHIMGALRRVLPSRALDWLLARG
ncbi:Putative oxidoreductase SadH [Thalassovita gelatinovora]|uniref:Putative oxidoreductase SadH n=1 Tax=Thalassovita gelatinovora TaxID=53501 RepID=A0A0P1F8J5_THAGE|nr:SDR family NAD(P)-dependent oxidoreductase [Thalassovita gelatinovora]QIZ81383.1 SDR family NAD(P)-dependent oxidoreductase [Thalassovita gelatinovora]CUH64407.1 Putative oxidoreductase SadH [Thalassovita gelatinovora]SER20630.1 Short-chain dehydrogenase [Thalassovita gelatinovora]